MYGCVQVVMEMFSISFKEALRKIANERKLIESREVDVKYSEEYDFDVVYDDLSQFMDY